MGDKLPSVELYENSPGNKVNILDLCKGKKVVLFAVPGAFTPGCSKVCFCYLLLQFFEIVKLNISKFDNTVNQTHLPGYVKEADNLKEHGIGEIICIAVNDAFVLNAWGREQGTEGKVSVLANDDLLIYFMNVQHKYCKYLCSNRW